LGTSFDTSARAECAGQDGGTILYIIESTVTSTCAYSSYWSHLPSGEFNAQCPHNPYLQALALLCAVLSPL
jgi:hypothetical protein